MGYSPAREADVLCRPTCPAVDAAFEALESALSDIAPAELYDAMHGAIWACCRTVKERGTELLREALVEACRDKQEAERLAEEREEQISRLEDEVAELGRQLREMETA